MSELPFLSSSTSYMTYSWKKMNKNQKFKELTIKTEEKMFGQNSKLDWCVNLASYKNNLVNWIWLMLFLLYKHDSKDNFQSLGLSNEPGLH